MLVGSDGGASRLLGVVRGAAVDKLGGALVELDQVLTEFVPGQPDPLAPALGSQARLGYFDRPYRLLSRRR